MTGIFQRRETVQVRAKKRLIHRQWYTMIHVLCDTPSNYGVDSASLASQTHFRKIKRDGSGELRIQAMSHRNAIRWMM